MLFSFLFKISAAQLWGPPLPSSIPFCPGAPFPAAPTLWSSPHPGLPACPPHPHLQKGSRQPLPPTTGREQPRQERERGSSHVSACCLHCTVSGSGPAQISSHEAGKVETVMHAAKVGKLRLGEEKGLHNIPQHRNHTWQERNSRNGAVLPQAQWVSLESWR